MQESRLAEPGHLERDRPVTAAVPGVAEIYGEYAAFVWRNLRRLGVPQASIEDAVQDVFLVVHRRLHEFEGRSSLQTWLFGIVMRVAARQREQHRSRAQRFSKVPDSVLEVLSSTTGPDAFDQVLLHQAADLLEWVLAELDEDKRSILIMVELEQMPVVEVAKVLDLNINSAYTRLRLARQAFDVKLERALGSAEGTTR